MPAREPPPRPRRPRAAAGLAVVLAAAAAGAGCGSAAVADLPPPAGPRPSPALAATPAGRLLPPGELPAGLAGDRGALRTPVDGGGRARSARVLPRERAVALLAADGRELARAAAGVGPTHAVSHERWLWVTDTRGEALLVFRLRPQLELVRRVYLPGGPYGLALDRAKLRLWVTLTATNELVELPAHGRPSELRRFPTVRQPDAVAVDPVSHRVTVAGRDARQELDPPPLGR